MSSTITTGAIRVDEQRYRFDTIGNHSYVRIGNGLKYIPREQGMIDLILNTLREFEKEYPEVEVTSWTLEHDASMIYGLWVNHKSKAN